MNPKLVFLLFGMYVGAMIGFFVSLILIILRKSW